MGRLESVRWCFGGERERCIRGGVCGDSAEENEVEKRPKTLKALGKLLFLNFPAPPGN